jgi:hypothetical protein
MRSLRIMIHNLNPHPSLAWFYYFIIFCSLGLASDSHGKTLIINHLAPDTTKDKRLNYSTELIKLALNKTLQPGETIVYKSIPRSSPARTLSLLNNDRYPNLILPLSYEDNMQESAIDYIPFPTELGALSYRICFVSPTFFHSRKKIQSISDLKNYSFGAGIGWPDVQVLKSNQLQVIEVSKYENIFKMLFNNRFDFFCRGLGEVHNEFLTFGSTYQLRYDQSFLIHVPMPRFFFVNKNNQELKQRLKDGLLAVYKDGSLMQLWKKHYAESVRFSTVKNRNLLMLENHHINNVQTEYQKYLLQIQDYESLH